MYGWRSERKQRLLDQLELQPDELEASATEDELAAERAAAGTAEVKGFTRRKPARKPLPAHLPRERVVVSPTSGAGSAGDRRRRRPVTPGGAASIGAPQWGCRRGATAAGDLAGSLPVSGNLLTPRRSIGPQLGRETIDGLTFGLDH